MQRGTQRPVTQTGKHPLFCPYRLVLVACRKEGTPRWRFPDNREWNAVERRQLYSIVGKRTGIAVSRHRAQRNYWPGGWVATAGNRLRSLTLHDGVATPRYGFLNSESRLVTVKPRLSAHSVTPHGGLTTLRHNSATFCCAPWRCSAIIEAQSRSTELSGGLNLMTYITFMKFDTFITGFKQTM